MKRYVYLLFSCLIYCTAAQAQYWKGNDNPEAIQFTYTIQYVTSQYKVTPTADWATQLMENNVPLSPNLSHMRSPEAYGFAIGLGVSKGLGSNAELRFVPTLTIADRILTYSYHHVLDVNSTGDPVYSKDRKVQASLVELPLSIKLKSDQRGYFGAYVTGGLKYSADISSSKRSDDSEMIAFEKMLKNKRSYVSYEAGLGLDLYFRYFKLSPEIKYSASFNSILQQENSVFSKPIDKLMLRNVTFSLYIQ
ncbi:outer membrane beta-barrel protein [Pedobacter sp.]|uniref:type IX secretion/gliding motility protein PorT/SprT n=1 Tax=Pedobacter sp. TaxID=1411316 RepID=UPI003D7FC612